MAVPFFMENYMWYTILLDKVFGGVTDYFKNKQKLKEVVLEGEIKRAQSIMENDQSIDMLTIKDRGWKDDVITYTLVSIVVLTVFNPLFAVLFDYNPDVVSTGLAQGFTNLGLLPEELWWGFAVVLMDTFGLRSLMRDGIAVFLNKKIKQK